MGLMMYDSKEGLGVLQPDVTGHCIVKGMRRTVQVCLIQDLGFDDLLDDVLQGDDAHHFVEGVPLAFIVHPLHDGQVRFSCARQAEIHLLGQSKVAHC